MSLNHDVNDYYVDSDISYIIFFALHFRYLKMNQWEFHYNTNNFN
jgi:hypothetical protein